MLPYLTRIYLLKTWNFYYNCPNRVCLIAWLLLVCLYVHGLLIWPPSFCFVLFSYLMKGIAYFNIAVFNFMVKNWDCWKYSYVDIEVVITSLVMSCVTRTYFLSLGPVRKDFHYFKQYNSLKLVLRKSVKGKFLFEVKLLVSEVNLFLLQYNCLTFL